MQNFHDEGQKPIFAAPITLRQYFKELFSYGPHLPVYRPTFGQTLRPFRFLLRYFFLSAFVCLISHRARLGLTFWCSVQTFANLHIIPNPRKSHPLFKLRVVRFNTHTLQHGHPVHLYPSLLTGSGGFFSCQSPKSTRFFCKFMRDQPPKEQGRNPVFFLSIIYPTKVGVLFETTKFFENFF